MWSICYALNSRPSQRHRRIQQMILSGRALEGETKGQTEYCMIALTKHHRECIREGCSTYFIKVVEESDESGKLLNCKFWVV